MTAPALELVAGVAGEQAAETLAEYELDPTHVLARALKHSRRGERLRARLKLLSEGSPRARRPFLAAAVGCVV